MPEVCLEFVGRELAVSWPEGGRSASVWDTAPFTPCLEKSFEALTRGQTPVSRLLWDKPAHLQGQQQEAPHVFAFKSVSPLGITVNKAGVWMPT